MAKSIWKGRQWISFDQLKLNIDNEKIEKGRNITVMHSGHLAHFSRWPLTKERKGVDIGDIINVTNTAMHAADW